MRLVQNPISDDYAVISSCLNCYDVVPILRLFQNVTEDTDVYQHVMWDVWMPHVRAAISSWDARNCDPALDFIDAWMPLLPSWMLDNILNQLVVTLFIQF